MSRLSLSRNLAHASGVAPTEKERAAEPPPATLLGIDTSWEAMRLQARRAVPPHAERECVLLRYSVDTGLGAWAEATFTAWALQPFPPSVHADAVRELQRRRCVAAVHSPTTRLSTVESAWSVGRRGGRCTGW
jgi:hypothetical protein